MIVQLGNGRTQYGPGVRIDLSGSEVGAAIDAWLVAHGVHVCGPRTITVNGELCKLGNMYVDPSGYVIAAGKKFDGRGNCRTRAVRIGEDNKESEVRSE